MPRYSVELPGGEGRSQEFNLCVRCAADPVLVAEAFGKVTGTPPSVSASPELKRVPHTSFDFSARPTACLVCARVLAGEDD